MKIAGSIIAGGKASRMNGREKPLLPFGAGCILDAMLERIRPQVGALAIDVRRESRSIYHSYEGHGIVLICDPLSGTIGPLGGVLGALEWLQTLPPEYEWLATFPGDCPSVPSDLVATLSTSLPWNGSCRPIVAFDGERIQSLCALWPRTALHRVREGAARGRSVRGALEALGATQCMVHAEFLNINTPGDLAAAQQLLPDRTMALS
jgi:molybdopterin-guanine dinucleotide biosynthesis protein A